MTGIPDGIELTPYSEPFYNNPYAVYADLRKQEHLHKDIESFYPSSWTITDFATIKQLLTDTRLSVDSRAVGIRRDPRADNPVTQAPPDMMGLDEPHHGRLRKLVQKAFTPSRVEAFRPVVEQIVERHITDMRNQNEVDVVTAFSKPIPTIAIAEFLGVDSADHAIFKQWTDSLLLQGYPMPTEAQWNEIVTANKALNDYMKAIVHSRKSHPEDDLVSALVNAHLDSDALSEDEIVAMCSLLIGAGNFTTTDLISNSLLAILQHPERFEHMQTSGVSIARVIEECLRFDSPVLAIRRFALADIELEDKFIKKGSVLNLVLGAGNHDPQFFEGADRFDPTSAHPPHLSFGRGIHHCLGAPLARLEAQISVARFFEAFPTASLVSHIRNKTMNFRGCRSLTVALNCQP